MLTSRQKYIDCTIDEARAAGCDCVQLKYDGWWSRIVIRAGTAMFFSRTERMYKTIAIKDTSLTCTLIGEHMHGTQWSQHPTRLGQTFIFDCWAWDGQEYEDIPYVDRYRIARAALNHLQGEGFTLAANYPIGASEYLWNNEPDFEGLVFRHSGSEASAPLYRCKRIVTMDLTAISFTEGQGKFAGTLGAITAKTPDNVIVDVGGGFSDAERQAIWEHRGNYVGQVFEVEAKAKFESGSLRHPNFLRWKENE